MSNETKIAAKAHVIKKGLRSIICFSTKYLNMKYKNKYLKKKIDFITVEKYPFQAFSSK